MRCRHERAVRSPYYIILGTRSCISAGRTDLEAVEGISSSLAARYTTGFTQTDGCGRGDVKCHRMLMNLPNMLTFHG